MAFRASRSVRIEDESEIESRGAVESKIKDNCEKTGNCFNTILPSRVFPEDYGRVKRTILDPRGQLAQKWNYVFFISGLVSLFVDPLFLFLPSSESNLCFKSSMLLQVVLTVMRTVSDVFYLINIFVKFRTAYVAPSSRVLGRGELVIDPWEIALRYVAKDFWRDFLAAISVPQVLVWAIIPNLDDSVTTDSHIVLRFSIMVQYFLRFSIIYPLSSRIVNATGVMTTETALVGTAYNMMLYLLASHTSGACFYILTVERQELCWRSVCESENLCNYQFFDCKRIDNPQRDAWFGTTNITTLCNPNNNYYLWGIYAFPMSNALTSSSFLHQYFYCLWIGIQALCSIGQTYTSSIFLGENIYCIANSTVGLILLALLIGNMRSYLQSIIEKLEGWRLKRRDTEQWMHHRQLPQELRECVRKYGQFKWVATQGVDEQALLDGLPSDLKRQVKRHLCIDLVRQVPLLDQMDDQMLDAICERLKPTFCIKGTYLLIEGDPVDEMLFIVRGRLISTTTNGGRTGFFNSSTLGSGDFCGEELLTWALDQRHKEILPSSTRTVEAISEVEAFSLTPDDLNFVASQYRRMHSRDLVHKFRFYSHQWRTWAACFIQAVWRRFKSRRGLTNDFNSMERCDTMSIIDEMNLFVPKPGSGLEVYAARLMNMNKAKSTS